MIEDFVATLALRSYEKGVELLYCADPDVPCLLRGDPGRLRQILVNLAGNAVKFTSAGEVVIRVGLDREDENWVTLRFSVHDTGIGIPEDKIDVLFNKFSQVETTTTRQYGGTGLGLAISKQLTELFGGEIGVSSHYGWGSEFWFTVRVQRQAGPTPVDNLPSEELDGVRILIVDDNATCSSILKTHLASWGLRPFAAEDASTALEALAKALEEQDPFRIALIDLQMPVTDGEALGKTIRAEGRFADTRLVLLSSIVSRGEVGHFQQIGFAGTTTKPVRKKDLKDVLSRVLQEGGGERKPAPPENSPSSTTLNLFAGRTARILLVEDNITNQKVALGMLKRLGLGADAAGNGAEAIQTLKSNPYDLVLMDVQMPVMDGFEATRQIRNSPTAVLDPLIPIIAMTAYAMRSDEESCHEAGMNDYITKPVSSQALADVLEKWLPV